MATGPRIPKADAKVLSVITIEFTSLVDFYRRRLACGDCPSSDYAHSMGIQASGWAYGVAMVSRKLLKWPATEQMERAFQECDAALKRDRDLACAWLREVEW